MTGRPIDLREAMQGEPHYADEDADDNAAFWIGRWEARGEVVQYGVTPGPTEHSTAEDPRA